MICVKCNGTTMGTFTVCAWLPIAKTRPATTANAVINTFFIINHLGQSRPSESSVFNRRRFGRRSKGDRRLRSFFSNQEDLGEAKVTFDWRDLKALGPVKVAKWELATQISTSSQSGGTSGTIRQHWNSRSRWKNLSPERCRATRRVHARQTNRPGFASGDENQGSPRVFHVQAMTRAQSAHAAASVDRSGEGSVE